MSLKGWRKQVLDVLRLQVGPVAEIILDDASRKAGTDKEDISPAQYLQFLRVLYEELPKEIDRRALCARLRRQVLEQYGFPSE